MLALSLTVIVLLAVNMAVDVHLRSLEKRRTQLEESQLARSILRMIADDLRSAVLHYEQDTSEIESLLMQSAASAAQSVGQAAAAVTGAQSTGSAAGGTTSSGISSGGSAQGGSAQGGSQAGSAASASGSSRGSSGGTGSTASLGGSTSAASGSSSNSSGSTGASSSNSSGSLASGSSSTETGQNTADLSAATIPPVPGLFGNQYQLQIDVSRLPRIENYQQYLSPDAATTVVDVPSDVKTVTYFVQNKAMASGSGAAKQMLQDLTDPDANATGLVRRELDRSVTMWAMNNGNFAGLQNTGDVIAPEVVAIEFQYFDGTEWVLEWDTEAEQKLPIAVLVILAIRPPGSAPAPDVVLSELTPADTAGLHLYRTLVYLPAGGQSTESESSAGTGDASGSSTTGDTSATGGSL